MINFLLYGHSGKRTRLNFAHTIIYSHVSHLYHKHPAVTEHFVLRREIDVPDVDLLEFQGEVALLVLIRDQFSIGQVDLEKWWANAPSAWDREMLRLCLMYDGFLLPIALATWVALVAEIYTKNVCADGQRTDNHRLRLSAGTSPISDFGVVKGFVNVVGQDRLIFWNYHDLAVDTAVFL